MRGLKAETLIHEVDRNRQYSNCTGKEVWGGMQRMQRYLDEFRGFLEFCVSVKISFKEDVKNALNSDNTLP